MAESNGCAKAFLRVTRGEPESTCSPGCELSNMRDWVATLGGYSTHAEMNKKFEKRNSKFARGTRLAPQTNFAFRISSFEGTRYFLAALALEAASAYFLVKRSTRPAVSTSFCLPVKNG